MCASGGLSTIDMKLPNTTHHDPKLDPPVLCGELDQLSTAFHCGIEDRHAAGGQILVPHPATGCPVSVECDSERFRGFFDGGGPP